MVWWRSRWHAALFGNFPYLPTYQSQCVPTPLEAAGTYLLGRSSSEPAFLFHVAVLVLFFNCLSFRFHVLYSRVHRLTESGHSLAISSATFSDRCATAL